VADAFDEALRERLIAFQTHVGLTAHGIADTATWNVLVNGATGGAPDPGAGDPSSAAGSCACDDAAATDPNGGEPPEVGAVFEDYGDVPDTDTGDEADVATGSGKHHHGNTSSVPGACRKNAKACFSVSQQRAWLLKPGRVVVLSVAAIGGRPGHETPVGQFSVHFHDKDHYSSKYHAPMKWYVNFTTAIGFHQGNVNVKSHGCVHLSEDSAKRFFDYLKDGDPVDVVP
jgi:hypothetical protein